MLTALRALHLVKYKIPKTPFYKFITVDFYRGFIYWTLVTGYWLLVSGYWLLVSGLWVLVAGIWSLVAGKSNLVFFVLVLGIRNFSRTRDEDEYDDEGGTCRGEVSTKADYLLFRYAMPYAPCDVPCDIE